MVIRYCISIAVRWSVEYKFLIEEFLIHNVYRYIYIYIYYNKNTGTHYSLKSNGTVLLKIPSFIMEK